jgi:signal transduction histidine kinase
MPSHSAELLPASPATRLSPWQEVALAVVVTLACATLAAYFELSEAIFRYTRRWEHFQLDEWPVAAFVFALCFVWISWRRSQQAFLQLEARRAAERRLAAALVENRELAQQHLHVQEAARKHLARELHDELGQYLNAIKLDAVAIREAAGSDDSPAGLAAARTVKAVDHVHAVVNDIIRRLRPAGLDELGLVAALENCVDHWRQRLPQTRLTLSVSGSLDDLGESLNLTIYRLIQEGLTNSFKHAGAGRIDINLSRGSEVLLTVADDGRGTVLPARSGGFGLIGMKERVELMGGTFGVESGPGRGFAIEARLPVGGRR